MKVGIATHFISQPFMDAFPSAEIIGNPDNVTEGKYDLVIFTGGSDINPSRYGETNNNSYGIDNQRDEIEFSIFNKIMGFDKPPKILGVCRGLQLINVGMNGSLVQDLVAYGYRDHPGAHAVGHEVKHAFDYLKSVNSMHHQGILRLGDVFRGEKKAFRLPALILSRHLDIIEMVMWGSDILATQFHPEFFSEEWYNKFFSLIHDWVNGKRKIVESTPWSTVKITFDNSSEELSAPSMGTPVFVDDEEDEDDEDEDYDDEDEEEEDE